MTNIYDTGATTEPTTDSTLGSAGGAHVADENGGVKQQASAAASEAGDAAKRVAETAKTEAGGVASEAKSQVRRLADRVGTEVRDQASTQQSRLADGLRSVGGEFGKMADSAESNGVATQVARSVGSRTESVADWFSSREPSDVLEEVKGFARRRPAVFLAIAAGAGLVIGRLSRALLTPDDDDDTSTRDRARVSTGSTAGYDAYGTGTTGLSGSTEYPTTTSSAGASGSTDYAASAAGTTAGTTTGSTYGDDGTTDSPYGSAYVGGAADVDEAFGQQGARGQGDPLGDEASHDLSGRSTDERGDLR